LVPLFPAGIYFCFKELRDEHVFVILYGLAASYFAGVMVRLMLTLTPVVCIAAAFACSKLLDVYLRNYDDIVGVKKASENTLKAGGVDAKSSKSSNVSSSMKRRDSIKYNGIWHSDSKLAVILPIGAVLALFAWHCTWVTSNAYSSPSIVLASRNPDGSQHIIDDFREAYYWLAQNTKDDARIMSWWDYGYQIAGMANRTTLVDNNTWNNTHIATVGKAMSCNEEVSYEVMRRHDVDYVLVIFGGLIGYSGDDINKFLWMIRIGEGVYPNDISERNFFTDRGEYRVDDQATITMKNSLMYKMSYYRFNELFPAGHAQDRVRGTGIQSKPVKLNVLEEAYSTENLIVRIYKVKEPDNIGR